ncbi:MAG: hypothetical protein R2802_00355 [Flavobacteriaceae bacterium]
MLLLRLLLNDDDIDGFTTFDLLFIEPQILENYPNLEFTYFETQQDIDAGTKCHT